MGFIKTSDFKIKSLGHKEIEVFDAEVKNLHNFFANDILVHNSNYVSLDQIIQKLKLKFNTHEEFNDWAEKFYEVVIVPLIDMLMSVYEDNYDEDFRINFKKEKLISSLFVVGKKHYALDIINDEGDFSEEPKFKIMGIETKKRNTPEFIRKTLNEVLMKILRGANKSDIQDFLRERRDSYEQLPIREIAIGGSISNYEKYLPKNLELPIEYIKKCPPRNKSAINYNVVIEHEKLNNREKIQSNSLMYYVPITTNNKFEFDLIGFVGDWPKEFDKLFEVDYNQLWHSTCMGLLGNWFEVLDWGEPKLESNSFEDYF